MSSRPDPLVRSSLREAILVTGIWFTAMVWSITVCYRMGYNRNVEDLKLVFGFPDWIFWGIVVPWCACTIASCLFSAYFFREGYLGEDRDDTDELGLGS